ncbi:MAG: hypothetical protein HYX80_02680 [Chloroflexi bacterium]|nr:hypothetical protein [Chloroflexota bacterium]
MSRLKVGTASLEDQYSSLIEMYNTEGINDAADLDQVGDDLFDLINTPNKPATKKLLQKKPVNEGVVLTLKDEKDINTLLKAKEISQKRIHNLLTNKVIGKLGNYTLLEGSSDIAMFDVLVKNFDNSANDLLIEVKSNGDIANIRMAVGQLFDYWYQLKGDSDKYLAILLPEEPSAYIKEMLNWLDISLLWFSGERLQTSSDKLFSFLENVNQ